MQKALARAGLGSRRMAEILIEAGRVTIDGRVAELGNRVDADTQE
ncbi:MAG: MFS transporter, partial [Actinobacteria bacterium]|nr:MFS transporter [Actinomycetota bacterium]